MDCFGGVLNFDLVAVGEVGNGAAELEDTMVGTGAQLHPAHREVDQLARLFAEDAKAVDLADAHVTVGEQAFQPFEALRLARSRPFDPCANRRR